MRRRMLFTAVAIAGLLGAGTASALPVSSQSKNHSISFSSHGKSYEDKGVSLGHGFLSSWLKNFDHGDRKDEIKGWIKKVITSIHDRPKPEPPRPAIPEPTAALVFASGLLLIARRRS